MTALNRLLLVALLIGVGGCRKADIRSFEIKIPEMVDASHRTLVVRTLENMEGVNKKSISIDKEKRVVRLEYDSMRTAEKNLEIAVVNQGMSANKIPANKSKATSLSRLKEIKITIPELKGAGSKAMQIGQYLVGQISKQSGVLSHTIRLDPGQGVLYAQYDSGVVQPAIIEKKISSLGFTANNVPADPAARAKLPPEYR